MRKPALLASLVIHVAAGLLLFLIGAVTGRLTRSPLNATLIAIPLHAPRLPAVKGGGGQNSPLPARRGRAPTPLVHKMFMPPMITTNNQPKLVLQEALMDSPELNLSVAFIGDPLGLSDLAASGPGRLGGIGDGSRGGIGPGDGSHLGGQAAPPRVTITRNPEVIHKVEPEYSEEARRARLEGTVVLMIDIGLDGRPGNIRIVHGAGFGLDERAIEAVRLWTFRPALSGDRPVVAPALVQVGFHLL